MQPNLATQQVNLRRAVDAAAATVNAERSRPSSRPTSSDSVDGRSVTGTRVSPSPSVAHSRASLFDTTRRGGAAAPAASSGAADKDKKQPSTP